MESIQELLSIVYKGNIPLRYDCPDKVDNVDYSIRSIDVNDYRITNRVLIGYDGGFKYLSVPLEQIVIDLPESKPLNIRDESK